MNRQEREEIRNKIIHEMEKIKGEIPALKKSSLPVSPDNSIGRLTRMEAINAQGVNETALNATKVRLERLEVALSKVDDEDFGICIDCDELISYKRLLARPESIKCIHCSR